MKHVHQYSFKPMVLDLGDIHFVKPHFVQGYIKEDGTVVKGYFRDSDGNTPIDRPLGAGGGYYAHNPGTAGLYSS
ncbi:hypothetical protein [Paenibacillus sp. MMS20-IR301]|uniref:hypothetical protein n=1 Tax=Paenibacillus sp. MMS20-IR301 TaxID=2895946 RepID=UPI0028F0EE5E|nr:hypothetical protein [Paenibacillus sp. MMS20-IR301]WNS42044.1 hypothetical protein LOS79_23975 [Paenibacillus sp. MMS20-IR301]